MKNLKVTAMILAATLSAGTLVACSSNQEANNTVSTVESETVESEVEESIATESESTESSELTEEQEMDALTEAVLQYITVARVEEVAEDGTLELTLFELPGASEEVVEDAAETTGTEAADAATETAGTEEAADVATETTETKAAELSESATTEETTAAEETAMTEESATTEETSAFDFASLDLSIFVEAGLTESYQPEETVMVQMVEDGALVEAALSDIQEGDMLVMFMDENELPNIVIYRNIVQEVVTE